MDEHREKEHKHKETEEEVPPQEENDTAEEL